MKKQDVSPFNMNCGLYSLALAISIALKKKPAYHIIPDFVINLEASDVSPSADHEKLKTIGQHLRMLLLATLPMNEEHKKSLKQSYIQHLITGLKEDDLESVLKSDPERLPSINNYYNAIVNSELWKDYKWPTPRKADDISDDSDVISLRVVLMDLIQQPDLTESGIRDILDTFNEGITSISKFAYYFEAAWSKINEGTKENRQKVKSTAISWLSDQFPSLNPIECLNNDYKSMREYAYAYTHMAGGDVQSSLKYVIASSLTSFYWDQIYTIYAAHLVQATPMLTSEELGCLAKAWGIGLQIYREDWKQMATIVDAGHTDITVTLYHNNAHYQVVLPENTPSEQPALDEAAAGIPDLDEESLKALADQEERQFQLALKISLENAESTKMKDINTEVFETLKIICAQIMTCQPSDNKRLNELKLELNAICVAIVSEYGNLDNPDSISESKDKESSSEEREKIFSERVASLASVENSAFTPELEGLLRNLMALTDSKSSEEVPSREALVVFNVENAENAENADNAETAETAAPQ